MQMVRRRNISTAEATMSSVEYLRDGRQNAAGEAVQTAVRYEEEVSRQRRPLDISRNPDIKLHIMELPQQHICKEEESLSDQQVCMQERKYSLDQEDPEPPQIKEEQEELCISQEGLQVVVKQEVEGVIVWTKEEPLGLHDIIWKPAVKSHGIDHLQQHVCKEEESFTDQQLCNQEANSSLDQEDPDPSQIKEEQEEFCISQEDVHLVVKEEADIFMVTPTYEESDHSEPEPNSDQLLSHNSPETTFCKTDRNKKSVKCETCGKTFQFKSKLTRHFRIHTGERPHSCSICGERFRQTSTLKAHVRIHTGEKPCFCSTCGKEFREESAFRKHMRIHTGEKPHSCSTCGKSFRQNSTLKAHVRTHTGEKPHFCSFCGKGFSQMINLKTHMRIHTDEKPHSCSNCGKSFRQMIHLKRHMRIHTG